MNRIRSTPRDLRARQESRMNRRTPADVPVAPAAAAAAAAAAAGMNRVAHAAAAAAVYVVEYQKRGLPHVHKREPQGVTCYRDETNGA